MEVPSDPIDLRKIATELSQQAIDRVILISENLIKDYWAKYKNRDISTYSEYLVRKSIQASAVRNFIYDNRSASLYDIYVPTMLSGVDSTGDELIKRLCQPSKEIRKKLNYTGLDDPKESSKDRPTPALAIVGRAGAGKSMFMKHAFFKIQNINAKRVPILIEARSFNRSQLDNLQTRISDEFEAMGTRASLEQIRNGLESGLFILLLDGMDELKGVIQDHYESELTNFVNKYPQCPIMVASRPTKRILSWAFDVRTVSPLGVSAAEDLIARLDFDERVKAAFIELLHQRLFITHSEFVSVPLLCTIMLLTFADSGRIASDRHEFFEDAFTALWSKHDNRKEGFERHRYSGLQKSEFLSLLSAFSISSYSAADYDMRPTLFTRHFKAASRLSGVNCKEDDFLQDLQVSTSLLVEDGPYIRFCHRSFQEYFAALFVAEADDAIVGELLEDLSDRIETDNVIPLAHSMNREKIEKNWVIPKMHGIIKKISAAESTAEIFFPTRLSNDGSLLDVSSDMHKLRILYKFEPTTETLQAAYDAARHMNVAVKRLTSGSTLKAGIFKRDQANFESLASSLEKKYRHRTAALRDLLSRSADQNTDA